jgi:hypothetical protein
MPIGIVHTSTFIALAMVPTTVFILHSCVSGRSGGPVMPRQTISGISSVGNLGTGVSRSLPTTQGLSRYGLTSNRSASIIYASSEWGDAQ